MNEGCNSFADAIQVLLCIVTLRQWHLFPRVSQRKDEDLVLHYLQHWAGHSHSLQ
jgi:hypothetical protein